MSLRKTIPLTDFGIFDPAAFRPPPESPPSSATAAHFLALVAADPATAPAWLLALILGSLLRESATSGTPPVVCVVDCVGAAPAQLRLDPRLVQRAAGCSAAVAAAFLGPTSSSSSPSPSLSSPSLAYVSVLRHETEGDYSGVEAAVRAAVRVAPADARADVVLLVLGADALVAARPAPASADAPLRLLARLQALAAATYITTAPPPQEDSDCARAQAAVVRALAHRAHAVLSLQPLATGRAADVTGTLAVARGGRAADEEGDAPVVPQTYQYHVSGDGVKIFYP